MHSFPKDNISIQTFPGRRWRIYEQNTHTWLWFSFLRSCSSWSDVSSVCWPPNTGMQPYWNLPWLPSPTWVATWSPMMCCWSTHDLLLHLFRCPSMPAVVLCCLGSSPSKTTRRCPVLCCTCSHQQLHQRLRLNDTREVSLEIHESRSDTIQENQKQ